jgi:membrane fusion protein, macrolide-specific efflux system
MDRVAHEPSRPRTDGEDEASARSPQHDPSPSTSVPPTPVGSADPQGPGAGANPAPDATTPYEAPTYPERPTVKAAPPSTGSDVAPTSAPVLHSTGAPPAENEVERTGDHRFTVRSTSREVTPGRIALVVCIVLALLLAFAIQRSISGGGAAAAGPSLATASIRSFPAVVTATGSAVPASQISLNFSASGQLTEIDTTVGATVTSGQVLAKIDDTLALAEIGEAQADITAAPNATALANARGALAKGQADLALTILHAPVAGTIEAINGQVGETVPTSPTAAAMLPGTSAPIPQSSGGGDATSGGSAPLFELDPGPGVVVGVTLSAGEAPQVAAGQKGQLTSEAVTGLMLPCHVLARGANAVLINGLPEFYATVVPDGSDARLLDGTPVTVNITVGDASNVLAVPNQAVYTLDGSPHVDVWFKGHAVPTVVTTGLVGVELTQVKSGLTDGQQVVVTAPSGLPAANNP